MNNAWQPLLANIAIITILISLRSHFCDGLATYGLRLRSAAFGTFCGGTGAIVMMLPFEVAPGFHFDMRSVATVLSGFFAGPLGALITAAIIAGTRITIGGAGVFAGLIGTALATSIGLSLFWFRRKRPIGFHHILQLAALSSAAVPLGVAFMPAEIRQLVFSGPILPAICLIFTGVLLSGSAILHDNRRYQSAKINELHAAVMQALPDCVNVKDLDGRFVIANQATARLMGAKTTDDLIGKSDFDFFDAEAASTFRADEMAALAADEARTLEQSFVGSNGTTTWLSTLKAPFKDADRNTIGLITHNRDITQQKLMELELRQAQQRLADALAHMADGLVMFDKNSKLVFCNQQYLDMFPETSGTRVAGAQLRDILEAAILHNEVVIPAGTDQREWVESEMNKSALMITSEIQLADARWFEKRTNPVSDGAWLTVYSDITLKKDAEAKLEEMARTDGLTGLLNRRTFDDKLYMEFSRAYRHNLNLGLMMIDVDHFKAYNDIYGHPAGDECLKAIAQCFKSQSRRPSDIVARYGGEEFVAVFPQTDEAGMMVIAESFRLAIRALEIPHAGSERGIVTVSVGVGMKRPGDDIRGPADLLKRSDQALYQAKDAGRDCTRCSSPRDLRAPDFGKNAVSGPSYGLI